MGKKRKAKQEINSSVSVSESQETPLGLDTRPELLAFSIRYGQLFNEYRWNHRWRVYLGFSKVLFQHLSLLMGKVIEKLQCMHVPHSLYSRHKEIASKVRILHLQIMGSTETQDAGEAAQDIYWVVINRKWMECDQTGNDAISALSVLDTYFGWQYDMVDSLRATLLHELNPPDQVRYAFDLGTMLDEIQRPSPPNLTDQQLRDVFHRVFYIRDNMKRFEEPTTAALHNLSIQNKVVTDLEVVEFIRAFCQGNNLHDFSNELATYLRSIELNFKPENPENPDNDQFTNEENKLQERLRLWRNGILSLSYDEKFMPNSKDLEKLRNFTKRMNAKISIPDVRWIFEGWASEANPDPSLLSEPERLETVDGLLNTLIRRERMAPTAAFIERIVHHSSYLPCPLRDLDFISVRESVDIHEREAALASIINDIANSIFYECRVLEKAHQASWLREKSKPSIYNAFMMYLRICEKYNNFDLTAAKAIRHMKVDWIGYFPKDANEVDLKNISNCRQRYINYARKMLLQKFGDDILPKPTDDVSPELVDDVTKKPFNNTT